MEQTPVDRPDQQPVTTTEPPRSQTKSRKWLYLGAGIIVTLLVATIAYLLLMRSADQPSQNPADDTKESAQSTDPKEAAAAQLEDFMSSVFSQLETKLADEAAVSVDRNRSSLGPAYKVDPAKNFYALAENGQSISIAAASPDASTDALQKDATDTVTQQLSESGFTLTEKPGIHRESSEYQTDQLVCSLHGPSVVLMCNSKLHYPTADQLEPFVTALLQHPNFQDESHPPVITLPEVEDSQSAGYLIARGQGAGVDLVGGAELLFYKKEAGSAWTFFSGAQGVLPCSAFSNDELRTAFKGMECLSVDSRDPITVQ